MLIRTSRPTGDLEWYDPAAVTTKDGKLVITMTEVNTHDLNFQSGTGSSLSVPYDNKGQELVHSMRHDCSFRAPARVVPDSCTATWELAIFSS